VSRYVIRIVPVGGSIHDLPRIYTTKREALKDLTLVAPMLYPDRNEWQQPTGYKRKRNGNAVVIHRDGEYVATVGVELAD